MIDPDGPISNENRNFAAMPMTDISVMLAAFNRTGRRVRYLGHPACPDCWEFLAFLLASSLTIDADVIRQVLDCPSVKYNIFESKSRVWVGICAWEFFDKGADVGAGYVLFGADKRVKQIVLPPFMKLESR